MAQSQSRGRSVVGIALVAMLSYACDGPRDAPLAEARVLPYSHAGVPWVFDDDGYQYLIDTGTPRSFVAPAVAGMDDDVFVTTVVDRWDIQGLGAGAEVVVTNELPPPIIPMVGPDFGGILAADLLSLQPMMLDPLRSRFILDDDGDFTQWLTQTDAPVRIPVTVTGGGVACMSEGRCFDHDGWRVLVDVVVEGQTVTALLDTGSTFTSMGVALFDRLEQARTRPEVTVSRGWDDWRFSRVDTLTVGDVVVDDMPVRINPMLDISLARLGVETGRRVEMLLGHSLFLQFATGIDHQAQVLTLARYHEPGALETEMFVGYGIWLVGSPLPGAAPRVAALAHGMEAQQAGIDIGDVIVGIDGRDTVSMTAVELDVALRVGAQGQTIELEVADVMQDGLRQSPPRRVALTKRDLLPAQ